MAVHFLINSRGCEISPPPPPLHAFCGRSESRDPLVIASLPSSWYTGLDSSRHHSCACLLGVIGRLLLPMYPLRLSSDVLGVGDIAPPPLRRSLGRLYGEVFLPPCIPLRISVIGSEVHPPQSRRLGSGLLSVAVLPSPPLGLPLSSEPRGLAVETCWLPIHGSGCRGAAAIVTAPPRSRVRLQGFHSAPFSLPRWRATWPYPPAPSLRPAWSRGSLGSCRDSLCASPSESRLKGCACRRRRTPLSLDG